MPGAHERDHFATVFRAHRGSAAKRGIVPPGGRLGRGTATHSRSPVRRLAGGSVYVVVYVRSDAWPESVRFQRRMWCPEGDLNPHALLRALAPQASASANSATWT